jgi:protein-S-isoprenylcysteine O-methyltransferase Ste14
VPLPAALRWTGAAICVLTACLMFWTMSSLGPNLTDTVVTRRDHTLVTSGPYRWVRHPFYDCMALFVLSLSLLAANWFLLATGILLFAQLALRSRTEEAELLARFGQPYRDYRSSTGRFLPRLTPPVR